jgi:hypothetical protein
MHPFSIATASYTFPEFLALTESLVTAGRTTGPNQSESRIHFTKLNLHRTRRWLKTIEPSPELIAALKIHGGVQWWFITEAWCSDSAQTLPLIAKAADASSIPLRIILRDDNLIIMDRYLTGTSRSIPKLVAFNADDTECFIWGPRPKPAQALYDDWKADPRGRDHDAFETELHTWYAKDRGATLMAELIAATKPC